MICLKRLSSLFVELKAKQEKRKELWEDYNDQKVLQTVLNQPGGALYFEIQGLLRRSGFILQMSVPSKTSEFLRIRRLGRMILFATAFASCSLSVTRYSLEQFILQENEAIVAHKTDTNETSIVKDEKKSLPGVVRNITVPTLSDPKPGPVPELEVKPVAVPKAQAATGPGSEPAAASAQTQEPEPVSEPASDKVPESGPVVGAETEQDYEACFVTCVFAPSVEKCDHPVNVTELQEKNPTFKYIAFTNLEDLEAPGWTKILKTSLPYKRFITHSRWGKFMSWKDPTVQKKCKVVFYMDGYYSPRAPAKGFQAEAKRVLESDVGFVQYKHDTPGPLAEFQLIRRLRKDIPSNIDASIAWLKAQPDFNANLTVYVNTFIGEYFKQQRPLLTLFQELSSNVCGGWFVHFAHLG